MPRHPSVWLGQLAGGALRITGAVLRPPAALAESLAVQAAERVIDRLLTSPEVERLVVETLQRPELERLVRQSLESELARTTMDQLLDSEEMALILERVANSPEVRSAIAAQSIGLADEVADQVRVRATAGDDIAERLARRLLRRRPVEPTPDGTEP